MVFKMFQPYREAVQTLPEAKGFPFKSQQRYLGQPLIYYHCVFLAGLQGPGFCSEIGKKPCTKGRE